MPTLMAVHRSAVVLACAVLALAVLSPAALPAQEPSPQGGQQQPAAAAPAAAEGRTGPTPPATTPRVVAARSNDAAHPQRVGLGDVLTVDVAGLGAYLQDDSAACRRLILFLDDMPIDGLAPDACEQESGRVRFTLLRTQESSAAWRLLFTEPWEFSNPVSVSVGADGRLPWPTAVEEMELVILPTLLVYAYFIGLAAAIVLAVTLARRTALLRDRSAEAAAGAAAPYSLARFQMAFWLFLVLAAYVFIWMITGELDTITGSVLALLGIGSGTALGAALIDQNPPPAPSAEGASTAAVAATAARPAGPPAVSRGFLRDVLTDQRGVSLHRFQLLVWTLVLGVIFCSSVYNTLTMPQFSPTLLGLMGISSGTYLGFKVPEQAAGVRGG